MIIFCIIGILICSSLLHIIYLTAKNGQYVLEIPIWINTWFCLETVEDGKNIIWEISIIIYKI